MLSKTCINCHLDDNFDNLRGVQPTFRAPCIWLFSWVWALPKVVMAAMVTNSLVLKSKLAGNKYLHRQTQQHTCHVWSYIFQIFSNTLKESGFIFSKYSRPFWYLSSLTVTLAFFLKLTLFYLLIFTCSRIGSLHI